MNRLLQRFNALSSTKQILASLALAGSAIVVLCCAVVTYVSLLTPSRATALQEIENRTPNAIGVHATVVITAEARDTPTAASSTPGDPLLQTTTAGTASLPTTTSDPVVEATRTPAPTQAPAPTQTLAPSATPTPTQTPAPSATSTPTQTLAPSATSTPTQTLAPTATSTPVVDQLAVRITERFGDKTFDTPFAVTTTDGAVMVTFEYAEPPVFLGKPLTGVDLLNHAELVSNIALYTIFHDFANVQDITIRLNVIDAPLYEVHATREEAYSFPTRDFVPGADPDVPLLSASAATARMYRHFDVKLLGGDLQATVTDPSVDDITAELEHWLSGIDITGGSVEQGGAQITLDMSDMTATLFEPAERNTARVQAYIEEQAAMHVIMSIGSVMDRFPDLQSISITVMLDGDVYSSYRSSRQQFLAIGSDAFIGAATNADYNAILARLTRQN